MLGENAVDFDLDIATAYDQTRPFLKKDDYHVLFDPIFAKIAEHRARHEDIRVLDAGCGTGRISIPLLHAYETWFPSSCSGDAKPRIELTAVDVSHDMLHHFENNRMAASAIRALTCSEIRLECHDIRDPFVDMERGDRRHYFDIIIGHWLFHTMLDWRTAALRLDMLATRDGYLLSFQESGAFYDALDGDFSRVEGTAKEFWSEFHRIRKIILQDTESGDAAYIPPSTRLGPRVSDARVSQMFRALGWEDMPIETAPIPFSGMLTIRDMIERVAFGRTFSNLRIGAEQERLREKYAKIAQQLYDHFDEVNELDDPVGFEFTINPKLMRRDVERKIKASSIVDIIHDTTSVRRSHVKFDLFNKESLGRRLAGSILPRFDMRESSIELFGDHLQFLLAATPFEGVSVHRGLFDGAEERGDELWCWLAGNSETDDVIHIFPSRARQQAKIGDPRVVPFEVDFELDDETWARLSEYGKDWQNPAYEAGPDDLLGPISDKLILGAMRCGLLSFELSNPATKHFVAALAAFLSVSSEHGCDHLYVIPVRRFEKQAGLRKANGILTGSKEALTYDTIGLLWLTVDHLIAEFHDRPAVRLEGQPSTLKAEPFSTAQGGPLPRVPAEISRFKLSPIPRRESPRSQCDILVLSSTDREREAINSSFGASNAGGAVVLPRYWRAKNELVIVHAEIPSGIDPRCAEKISAHLIRYSPRLAILAGVMAGARPHEQAIGDVVVADRTIAINLAREKQEGDELRQEAIRPLSSATGTWLKDLVRKWSNREFALRAGINRVHLGSVLSGFEYKEDPKRLYHEAEEHEALGYEMEAHHFSRAADDAHTPWLVIKGISDSASGDNYYQPLAAFRTAEFIQFLCREGNIRSHFPVRDPSRNRAPK